MPRTIAITLLGSGVGMVVIGAILYTRGSAIGIPLVLVGLADLVIAAVVLRKDSAR
jgi:hypothetical protein